MKTTQSYSKEHIPSLDVLSHVRLRPTAYIQDTSVSGQCGIIKEILDNSLDEIVQGENKYIRFNIFHSDMKKYIVSIEDNGRGIPHERVKDVFTKPFTSGKFNTVSYEVSSGLYGIGAKATVALSSVFKVISIRENKLTSMIVVNDDIKLETIEHNSSFTGTIVQFLIDDNTIFHDIDEFLESGYKYFIEFISKLCLFRFTIGNNQIDFNLVKVSSKKAFKILEDTLFDINENDLYESLNSKIKYKNGKLPYQVIDSFNTNIPLSDKKKILLKLMNPNVNITSKHISKLDNSLIDTGFVSDEGNIRVLELNIWNVSDEKLFSKFRGKRIGIVNNIIFENITDFHFSILVSYLKEKISPMIENTFVREFFYSTQYKLPFFYKINIKYNNATFVGTTKHAFRDINFKKEYRKLLEELERNGFINISDIFDKIHKDIEIEYSRSFNKLGTIKSNKKLILELNRPTKFCDCLESINSITELFLMEGDSAKSIVGRNERIQALYTLGGKPCNSLLSIEKQAKSIDTIMKNKILSDIIKILNIKPMDPTLEGLRYNKIFIMSDADTHGYHIASIIMGNLMVYNKYLIEKGHLYLVIPPLYSLRIRKSLNSNNTSNIIYIRSEYELMYIITEFIYSEIFDIVIKLPNENPVKLPKEAMVVFLKNIFDITNEIETISNTFNIPPLLLELLIKYLSKYDYIDQKDLELFRKNIGADYVKFSESHNILIISIGIKDYIIPLVGLQTVIEKKLLPILSSMNWSNLRIFISTKKGIGINKPTEVTFVQLKQFCDEFKKFYLIERYKGIGSMRPKDREISCMNPDTRVVFRVDSIGDIAKIYDMLGSSPDMRKQKLLNDVKKDFVL